MSLIWQSTVQKLTEDSSAFILVCSLHVTYIIIMCITFLISFKLVNTNMRYSSIIISTSFIFSNLWLCRRPFHKCTINKICQVPAWSFHRNYVLWKTVLIQILYLTDNSGLNTWLNHAGFEFPWNFRAALNINFS